MYSLTIILKKMTVTIESVILKLIYVLPILCIVSCQDKKVNKKTDKIYVNEKLEDFLARISNSDSIKTVLIKLKELKNVTNSSKEISLINDSINITYKETYFGIKNLSSCEVDSVINGLKFNNRTINKIYGEGIVPWLEFDSDEFKIKSFSFDNRHTLYLLKSSSYSPYFSNRLRDTRHGYLILDNGKEAACFCLGAYNVPNDFYVGKYKNKLITLYIDANTISEKDKEDYIFDITAYSLNFKTGEEEPILINNKQVKIQVAIPRYNDFSKYRIISKYWW